MCRCVRNLVLWCGTLSSIFLLFLAWTSVQPKLQTENRILHAELEAGLGISEVLDVPDVFVKILGFDLPRKDVGKIVGSCDLESMEFESFFQQTSSHRFLNRRLLNVQESSDNAAAVGSPIVAESSVLDTRSIHPYEPSQRHFHRPLHEFSRSTRYSDQFNGKRPARRHFGLQRRPPPGIFVPYYQRTTRNEDPMFMQRPYFGQPRPVFFNPQSAVHVETPSDREARKSVESVEHPKGRTFTDEVMTSSPSQSKEVAVAPLLETPGKSIQASDISAALKEEEVKENQGSTMNRLKLVSKLVDALPKMDKEVIKLLKPADIPVILNKMAELERAQSEAANEASSALADETESKSEMKDPSSSPAAEKDGSQAIEESKSTQETLGSPQKSSEALDLSSNAIAVTSIENDSRIRQRNGNCRSGGCTCKQIVSFMGEGIPREAPRLCDGRCDCPDCSDERDQCAVNFADGMPTFATSCFGATPSECTQCRENERSCTDPESLPDRNCYSQDQECDGRLDCRLSGKDESVHTCLSLGQVDSPVVTPVPLNPHGVLYRKVRGSWYMVCNVGEWVPINRAITNVCHATVGIFTNGRPIVEDFLPASPSTGSYARWLRGRWIVQTGCLQGTIIRVKCPTPSCGRSRVFPGLWMSEGQTGGQLSDQPQEKRKRSEESAIGMDEEDDRIIGGAPIAEKDFPWIVSVKRTGSDGASLSFCGGYIFKPDWIVTAAHCFFSVDNATGLPIRYQDNHFSIIAGHVRLLSASPSTQVRTGVLAVVHEDYPGRPQNPQPRNTFVNDIGIIKVDVPFVFNVYVNALCLPSKITRPRPGTRCFLRGWGTMRHEIRKADHLQGISLRIHEPCTAWRNALQNPDKQVCATTRDVTKGACTGDSGGPLVCGGPQGFVAEGVVSYGLLGCGRPDNPTVFTRISTYLDWIESNINKEATGALNTPEYLLGKCRPELSCGDGRCLAKKQICNGVYDCPIRGEDEDESRCARVRSERYSPLL